MTLFPNSDPFSPRLRLDPKALLLFRTLMVKHRSKSWVIVPDAVMTDTSLLLCGDKSLLARITSA